MSKKIVIKVNNPEFDYDKLADKITQSIINANEEIKLKEKTEAKNKKFTKWDIVQFFIFSILFIIFLILSIICFFNSDIKSGTTLGFMTVVQILCIIGVIVIRKTNDINFILNYIVLFVSVATMVISLLQ